MKEEHINVLKKSILKNGIPAQLGMVSEEIGEYLQAINKISRLGGIHHKGINQPNKTDKGNKYSLAYWGLCSEVADLKIMVKQLELMLNQESIDISVERKIERLEKRLK